jgi:predicted nucleic acid-binding protein
MTYYFTDTSALIKRYVREVGTTWIRSITTRSASNIIFVAHIIADGAGPKPKEIVFRRDDTHSARLFAHECRLSHTGGYNRRQ